MEIIIVTGMSGAGKSTALHMLEDADFFCVDNLPLALFDSFAELSMSAKEERPKIVLGADVRSGVSAGELREVRKKLEERGIRVRVLFLDAGDEALLRRYKETRRVHPLMGEAGTIEAAISLERGRMAGIREGADHVIDTTHLLTRDLQNRLYDMLLSGGGYNNLNVTLMTFGYKYGLPEECDFVFDVRFLPNPYYEQDLKRLTGEDPAVRDYVLKNAAAEKFLDDLSAMVRFLIPEFVRAGRNRIMIGIGCTGGRHRSVSVATALYEKLEGEAGCGLNLLHRDMDKNR